MKLHIHCKLLIVFLLTILTTACAAVPDLRTLPAEPPPVMAMDELVQPYERIARIQVVREVYFTDYKLSQDPNLHEWAIDALQTEAAKLGADALILPEISSEQINIAFFPSFPATRYRAGAVAIKFK